MSQPPPKRLSVFRLVWSPWSLPRVAAHCSTLTAVIAGSAAATLGAGWLLGYLSARAGEPYLALSDYLLHMLLYPGQFWGFFLLFPFLAGLLLYGPPLITLSRIQAGVLRTLWLGLVPLVVPVLGWSLAIALFTAADPSFGIASGKPAWADVSALWLLASPWWLLLGALMLVGLWIFGIASLHHILPPVHHRRCEHCDYDLDGVVSNVCPECGAKLAAGHRPDGLASLFD